MIQQFQLIPFATSNLSLFPLKLLSSLHDILNLAISVY